MAIENNFLHFENDETFQNQKSEIKEDSITFIKDSGKIYTHEKEYKSVNWSTLKKPEAKVGDVCFYDKEQDKLIIVSEWSAETHPASRYTPIGIVVIPSSHDVYGTGEAGVMSLKEMNYNTPNEGSISYLVMYWGEYRTDISELTNYNVVCHIGNNGNPQSTIQGITSRAYLPSDKFDTVQCPHDTDAYYNYDDSDYCIPSPYLTDGSRNPLYYQTTSPSSANNAMSDFDGKNNSQVLWDRATAQSDWKTASTITNNSGSGYSPAAQCCWRYHTEGTSQGDWYLPACGELGYILPPFNKINNTISQLCTAYGSSVGVELGTSDYYWSSTEYSSYSARYVYTNNGNVNYNNKNYIGYVRAWLRVKP